MDRLGHYLLEARIGAGGMGEVYRARDAALGRQAAVKVILPGGDPALRDRLLREAQSTARLQHPFIATFFDGGIDEGRAWLALEYVSGETLRSRLARGALPLSEAVALGLALLEALAHAHAAGVLHRDLKPENVMLRPDGHMKLLDFGLARAIEAYGDQTIQQLTMVGLAVGTIGYMPPEQLHGDLVDARADLFAVGAVLHECLTGRPAFAGRTAVERIAAVLADERPGLPPEVPPGLANLIARALAKSPDARPPSAAAFLRELRTVSEHGDTAVIGAEPATLAVADFDNLSADPSNEWIGSGIAESVGSDLARVSGLQVIARERWLQARAAAGAASVDPLAVAQGLGARWLLSGGFQRIGPVLRLTARLADVSSAAVTWADKLDGPVEQIFSMQDRIGASVASALNLNRPTPVPIRPQLTAYECYARGRRLFERLDKSSIARADELYQQAIELDPAYAPAYAGLSGMYAMRYTFTTDPSVLQAAIDCATRALAVDSSMGEPHIWRGYALWRLGRHEDALEEMRQGMALDRTIHKGPYFSAGILIDLGRPEEALPLAQQAVETTSTNPYPWLMLGLAHMRLGALDEARYCFEQAARVEQQPENPIVGAEGALAEALRRAGQLALARAGALRALERIEGADHMYRDTQRGTALIVLGRCAFDQQDYDAAAAAFGQAAAHLRGRPKALGGGHLLVQALAGLAGATRSRDLLDESLELFDERGTHHFGWAFLADEAETRLHLALAASRLNHPRAGALVAAALPAAAPHDQMALERRSG